MKGLTDLERDDQVHLLTHSRDEFCSQVARKTDLWIFWMLDKEKMNQIIDAVIKTQNAHRVTISLLLFVLLCSLNTTASGFSSGASLTHDLLDGDGLRESGGGAATSDVYGHHSEQQLLPDWETFDPVLVHVHWLLVGLNPLVSCWIRNQKIHKQVLLLRSLNIGQEHCLPKV